MIKQLTVPADAERNFIFEEAFHSRGILFLGPCEAGGFANVNAVGECESILPIFGPAPDPSNINAFLLSEDKNLTLYYFIQGDETWLVDPASKRVHVTDDIKLAFEEYVNGNSRSLPGPDSAALLLNGAGGGVGSGEDA